MKPPKPSKSLKRNRCKQAAIREAELMRLKTICDKVSNGEWLDFEEYKQFSKLIKKGLKLGKQRTILHYGEKE